MPVSTTHFPTIVDLARQGGGKDSPSVEVAEVLARDGNILGHAVMVAQNTAKGHKVAMRSKIAVAEYTVINQGIESSKGAITSVIEVGTSIGSRFEIDERELEGVEDPGKYLATENEAHLQGINNKVEDDIFYGDQRKNEKQFNGLATRYDKRDKENIGKQIVIPKGSANPATSATDCTSVWLIGWGQDKVHLFAKPSAGAPGSIKTEGFSHEPTKDSKGRTYYITGTQYSAEIGLAVGDYRYASRIANLSKAKIESATAADVPDMKDLMRKSYHRIKNIGMCKPVFYMNRDVYELLTAQLQDNKDNTLTITYSDWENFIKIPHMFGIPIVTLDVLDFNEKALA